MSNDFIAIPRPLPGSDDVLTEEFYSHCARGELRFQRCAGCAAWRHLPRFMCARCGSSDWSWECSTGRGRIFSWTVTHQAVHPAFAADLPYTLVIVEMKEGVRLVSALRGPMELAPALDMPVQVEFEQLSDSVALPYFHAVAPGEAQP